MKTSSLCNHAKNLLADNIRIFSVERWLSFWKVGENEIIVHSDQHTRRGDLLKITVNQTSYNIECYRMGVRKHSIFEKSGIEVNSINESIVNAIESMLYFGIKEEEFNDCNLIMHELRDRRPPDFDHRIKSRIIVRANNELRMTKDFIYFSSSKGIGVKIHRVVDKTVYNIDCFCEDLSKRADFIRSMCKVYRELQ